MKGYAAYAKVQPTKEGYRDLEYKVLGTVTGALIKASEPETEQQISLTLFFGMKKYGTHFVAT